MNPKNLQLLLIICYVFLAVHFGVLLIILSNYFDDILYASNVFLFGVVVLDISIILYIIKLIYRLKDENTLKNIFFEKKVFKQQTYLKYAAHIIRHDLNSGINIYLPRGVNSLKRTLGKNINSETEKHLNLIERGLLHSKIVYSAVREFTDMFKNNTHITVKNHNIKKTLQHFLKNTHYRNCVHINNNVKCAKINRPLFCVAIDNLIRNGLTYNDSKKKKIEIFRKNNTLFIKDNGRGLTKKDFLKYSEPFKRGGQEKGDGLGLAIAIMILNEHNFEIDVEPNDNGTTIMINMGEVK